MAKKTEIICHKNIENRLHSISSLLGFKPTVNFTATKPHKHAQVRDVTKYIEMYNKQANRALTKAVKMV